MPKAKFVADNAIIDRMQKVRSPREIEMFRAAAQLISASARRPPIMSRDPGVTDAEIYAAFTFAQLARGGETGDGYQIGINQYGTHCGKPYGHVVRPGDLINLYISNVTYQRLHRADGADDRRRRDHRAAGEGARRLHRRRQARRKADPARAHSSATSTTPPSSPTSSAACWPRPKRAPCPTTGSYAGRRLPRLVPRQYVPDADWEAQGRKLMHVYPATHGPHNPNLGHSVGMAGAQNSFNVSSHNYDRLEEGMVFVLHTQWLEAQSAGCNIGDCYVVTADGFENLSRHTPARNPPRCCRGLIKHQHTPFRFLQRCRSGSGTRS